ncbi:putative lipoprotein [Parvularcula bermudensis HTCC2503]|uniref:Putative lipoprotein n=1 Tax=Parvularcula bermudensis (strain ATCC BAA-594 / HTCC2503 / KCTC 12087) TaxID=314260 RepID=E0TBP7_PARBH|nr:hypothetical protein [Parvularcula bermudensis]ADM09768.1 putative lipoprotein [Parvularcula bermudensis HTCC2503]
MTSINSIRGGLLLTSACAVLAACSGSGEVANSGETGDVIIGGGSGGGAPVVADGEINFVTSGCPDQTVEETVTIDAGNSETVDITACVIRGTILEDTTLDNGNLYVIDGRAFVGQQAISGGVLTSTTPVTLTIEDGTVVAGLTRGDGSTDGSIGTLIVTAGSQIDADGTATSPIIFTSIQDLVDADLAAGDISAVEAASDGLVLGESDVVGQWGGLVINGFAPINDCANGDETPQDAQAECVKDGEGGSGFFGGDQPADNSGTLRYVRVQYAGFGITADDELNGIAFQGVGSGTTVDYIQVHNNDDDGVEFFGGTVNADHVVITGAGDDSIDWTDGWTGSIQYAVVVQTDTPATNRGIEGDNRNGDNDVLPQSDPAIANFTFVTNFAGDAPTDADDGIKLRRGTLATLANGIVVGFEGQGCDFDDPSAAQDNGERPELLSIFTANNDAAFDGDCEPLFTATGNGNVASAGTTLNGLFSGPTEQAVAAADLSAFTQFDNVDYIGAFDDSVQTIEASWLADWVLATPLPNETSDDCPVGTTESTEAVPAGRTEANICVLPKTITQDTTLTRGNLYQIAEDSTFVGTDAGPDGDNPFAGAVSVTLTIDPGVTVFGEARPGVSADALIVTRGSMIESNGTSANPVIFTSRQDVEGTVGEFEVGQWGGIVINGRAPINDCANGDETPQDAQVDCVKDGEGSSGFFGGNKADDDSGNLTYTRVQYAGFGITADDELNGIAFQGVGSETDVNYIQVHNNDDDGVEFFGGTVSAKYVVITGAGDDSIDWTDGWIGNIQYAIVVQTDTPATNRGMEGDNRNGDNDVLPQSNPWIANYTLATNFAGSAPTDADDGIKLRRGTRGLFANGIVVNFEGQGCDYDDPSAAQDNGERPSLFSNYMAGNAAAFDGDCSPLFSATGAGNVAGTDSTLLADTDGTDAALLPNTEITTSVTAYDTDGAATGISGRDGFFDDADYPGAIENDDDNWYVGWTFGL